MKEKILIKWIAPCSWIESKMLVNFAFPALLSLPHQLGNVRDLPSLVPVPLVSITLLTVYHAPFAWFLSLLTASFQVDCLPAASSSCSSGWYGRRPLPHSNEV